VAAAFLDEYRAHDPSADIDHYSLFEAALPSFDQEAAEQKMQHIAALMTGGSGIEPVGKWRQVIAEIDRLKRADKLVISAPMWNFSIPYRLKQYIDIVVQPGHTFHVTRSGEYRGLVCGKPLQLILASGSAYAERFPQPTDGAKTDFQRAYLEHMARFVGFEDIRVIKIQPTAAGGAAALLDSYSNEAREAARRF
jgi:FMN-dependent NADH-azoreductase